jgi:hypothetical protein
VRRDGKACNSGQVRRSSRANCNDRVSPLRQDRGRCRVNPVSPPCRPCQIGKDSSRRRNSPLSNRECRRVRVSRNRPVRRRKLDNPACRPARARREKPPCRRSPDGRACRLVQPDPDSRGCRNRRVSLPAACPLSPIPVSRFRVSDRQVSRFRGSRHCRRRAADNSAKAAFPARPACNSPDSRAGRHCRCRGGPRLPLHLRQGARSKGTCANSLKTMSGRANVSSRGTGTKQFLKATKPFWRFRANVLKRLAVTD